LLDPDDLTAVTSTFNVSEEQMRRDHLIGHLLAAIQAVDAGDLVFFGALGWD
jgi:hypothetical protein